MPVTTLAYKVESMLIAVLMASGVYSAYQVVHFEDKDKTERNKTTPKCRIVVKVTPEEQELAGPRAWLMNADIALVDYDSDADLQDFLATIDSCIIAPNTANAGVIALAGNFQMLDIYPERASATRDVDGVEIFDSRTYPLRAKAA